MKRSPLKPGAALRTNKPLKAKKRLSVVGRRKKAEIKAVGAWRREYLGVDRACQIGNIIQDYLQTIEDSGPDFHRLVLARSYCRAVATGLHEIQKRSAHPGNHDLLLDPSNLLRACGPCNTWVEDNTLLAQKLGLSVPVFDTYDIL